MSLPRVSTVQQNKTPDASALHPPTKRSVALGEAKNVEGSLSVPFADSLVAEFRSAYLQHGACHLGLF
eukprot:6194566-Pleurochrysis_carterae.AAC.6